MEMSAEAAVPPEPSRARRTPAFRDPVLALVSGPLADLSGAWLEVPESTALALEDGVLSQRPFRPR